MAQGRRVERVAALIRREVSELLLNGIRDEWESYVDSDSSGTWNGPTLVTACEYRDGSYWLTPEMYVNNGYFRDLESMWTGVNQDPYVDAFGYPFYADDSLYFTEYNDGSVVGEWVEGNIFGGHDRFYSTSNALTNEPPITKLNEATLSAA